MNTINKIICDFFYLTALSCENIIAEDLSDQSIMMQNNWSWSLDGVMNLASIPDRPCSDTPTFHGYKNGNAIGWIRKDFESSGLVTLNFGNCWDLGEAVVYLNGAQIASVPVETYTTITFNVVEGDYLELKDEGMNSVVHINSMSICEMPLSSKTYFLLFV